MRSLENIKFCPELHCLAGCPAKFENEERPAVLRMKNQIRVQYEKVIMRSNKCFSKSL